ncbi:MAG: flagellar protein FlaG [Bryobacterales bacterium]|nr:flagellar protein FlaG [Bryobacterales bacterium]
MDSGSISPVVTSLAAAASNNPKPSERMTEHRELIQAVRALNGAEVFGQNEELTFQLDRDTHRPVLRIVDRKTGEVLKQVPPESVLRWARRLNTP